MKKFSGDIIESEFTRARHKAQGTRHKAQGRRSQFDDPLLICP
jgi:hypothetical protein